MNGKVLLHHDEMPVVNVGQGIPVVFKSLLESRPNGPRVTTNEQKTKN